jgi:hypothetical protein
MKRIDECKHPNPERGIHYDYCPDCGATKHADKPEKKYLEQWHTCDACRFPLGYKP